MENYSSAISSLFQTGNNFSLFVITGISAGSNNHRNRRFFAPLKFGIGKFAIHGLLQNIVPVSNKTAHHRLDFRITETDIEFQNFRDTIINHDSTENDTAEVEFFLVDTLKERFEDLGLDQLFDLFGNHRSRRICTHTTGIGTFVVIKNPFMILGRNHLNDRFAIGQCQYTGFFTKQHFFDDHLGSGGAECTLETFFDKIFRAGTVFRDQHTFTGGKPVSLDHNSFGSGIKLSIDIITGFRRILKSFRSRSGDTVFYHEFFGEVFTAFQLGSDLIRAENLKTSRFENIHHTVAKRSLGTDNRQIDLFFDRKIGQFIQLIDFDIDAFRILSDTGVTGCTENFSHLRALFQLPHQRVFATAGTDHQNFFHTDFSFLYQLFGLFKLTTLKDNP